MEKRGFGRSIWIAKEEQRLPWGTYIGLAEKTGGTKERAGEFVSEAVKETGHTSSFVVVETDVGMQVSNLEPVEQPKTAEENLLELLEQLKKRG